ncbi:MAG: hypothetical protein ABI905_00065 [Betaproteobacteria bacterium]
MRYGFQFISIRSTTVVAVCSALLAACGGGGGGNTADITPRVDPPVTVATGPDNFLLFPNPQVQADGTMQTNTATYQQAYYAAIDPTNARDTLAKWKAANGFDTGSGSQITVVFGDKKDLGYGRRMNARRNADGTLAFFVENYLIKVNGVYGYSTLNLDAAVVRDTQWMVGINAIEFSPGPNGGAAFPKFYNFNAVTGVRATFVDLDGRGDKAMPGPCISCHGGRGDALTPPDATGKPRFNLVQNGVSQARGDVQAHMHPFELDAFDFSASAGFTRADQEAAIKTINKWILCSYPIATASSAPEDACRRPAGPAEWQGTAADLIKTAYGGDGMPNATWDDTYVPTSWVTAGQTSLYKDVVAPSCRTCHLMRGTALQSDLDFNSYDKFQGYADRIKAHIIDRGNMPLAKIVYDAYYNSSRPETMATFLQAQGFTAKSSTGLALRPGRPIADPGPSRVVKQGATTISGTGSLYANGYQWTLVSGPAGGATLANATSSQVTFTATQDGTYVLQLIASNGSVQSTPVQATVVVNNALSPAPAAIRFADIKTVLQSSSAGCTAAGCHSVGGGTTATAPVLYTSVDRNGDGNIDATDDQWFYAEVRSRINFTDVISSSLLRKPSNHHHSGLLRPGFDSTAAPGNSARASYDMFQNWILNGAPQ